MPSTLEQPTRNAKVRRRPATASSAPRLSDCARHVVYPKNIVTTAWPRVAAKCVEFDVTPDFWQEGVGTLALGKRRDGKYAATVGGVVLSIPRQVGKTFLVGVILVALCLIYPNMTVLWTAHHSRTSTRTFQVMQGLVKRKKIRPHLAPTRSEGIRTANGEQEIRFRNGSVIMFGAREHGFGRGLDQVDVEVFDEAQILTAKTLEDMVPAVNQSQHEAGGLLFFIGTPPRPSDPGDEFTMRRTKALSGKAPNMVYVEFSADDDADPDDPEQWAKANPSYPTRTPVESMERMREQLIDDDSFRREALGIWDRLGSRRVIDSASWATVADPASMAVDRLALGIDVAPDRSVGSVALAGQRPDGLWHVELDEHRSGTGWIVPWVVARCERNDIRAVVIDALSPAASLLEDFTAAKIKVTVTTARDMANACGQFYDGVMDARFKHTDQPQVNVALSVAGKRTLGDAWAWNRKSAVADITPIVAETLALWGSQTAKPRRPGGGRDRTSGRRATVL